MKKLTKILSCGACLTMAAIFTAGCTPGAPNGAGADPETRAFVMAIGATDGNFSPFFATAQYDTQVTELTQISMLAANEKGEITYGENEPCVVLDYKETFYDANDNVIESGSMDGYTEYEFVIKNGIKYSNGSELTIKDVLFNLYVYLDPVYFGSSTIYSTDIVGLADYRAQEYGASSDNDVTSGFNADAQSRINSLMEYLKYYQDSEDYKDADLEKDIVTLKELYLEEVTSDWTSSYGSLDSYKEEYRFTSNWEIYYFNEGLISKLYKRQGNGNYVEQKDDNDKYLTSLDELDEDGFPKYDFREEMENALKDEAKIKAAMDKYDCTREEALDYVERDTAIQRVYDAKAMSATQLRTIFTEGWATYSNLLDKFAKEAMTKYYDEVRENNDGKLVIESIEGITTEKTSTFKGKNLGASHDVLKVKINGVDPKAIWNMAFQVAPAYYYSGMYKGTDYSKVDISKNQFGVCFGDANFFDTVLNATSKSKLPVGAGAYQASTANGGTTNDGDKFHNNKVTYYIRNNNFESVGKGISNAKIKYVRYREVEEASLVQTLKTGSVDYGEPSCTPANIKSLEESKTIKLAKQTPDAAGYGYVGLNPKYIPDIEVRRTIMSAMKISTTVRYYSNEYASNIYRPMSKANWVYKDYLQGVGAKKEYTYEPQPSNIRKRLEDAGWDFSSGVGKKGDETLKYTFTIAGGTEDHPAFAMFKDTANILNQAGFQITVMTSTDALKSLATGALTVWAAAYTSPVDPDLYQVYHKDSKATSVKNWGYDVIKQNNNGIYSYEKSVLEELSDLIIEARQTTIQSERGPMYAEALDLIMDMAFQLPTYQRKDLVVYNRTLLDSKTLNTKASAYAGVLNRIWEVNYSK